MNKISHIAAIAVLWFALPLATQAHGDMHDQIVALTKQLEKDPRNTDLLLHRGELHRAHQDYDAAFADFERAATVNTNLPILDMSRGRLFHQANWPLSARVVLDRFLSRHPNHVEARTTRAKVLVQLGERLAGARDYTEAIKFSTEPQPELYIERAQALTAEGDAHFAEALRGLDEGVKKLGPLVTLQLYAIDVELKRRDFDAALGRLDAVSAKSPRKETWLARRGEILELAGRADDAKAAFQSALAALDTLPPARRNVPAMQELEKRLRAALTGGAKAK